MSGGGWRPHLESALCLNLARLFATGCIRAGCTATGTLTWQDSGRAIASVGYNAELRTESGTLTLDYTVTDRDGERMPETSIISLSSIPLHFGGRKWFMHCPATGRTARKLYKWSGLPLFRHRTAVRPLPTYASQRVSGSDRINMQRWAIRRRIGDHISDLSCEPFKPKGMRWRTFDKHAARDAELAERDSVYLFRLIGRLMGAGLFDEAEALKKGG